MIYRLILLAAILVTAPAEAKEYSYHFSPAMANQFTPAEMASLRAGMAWGCGQWSHTANLSFHEWVPGKSATTNLITIAPTAKSNVWAYVPRVGARTIFVSYAQKDHEKLAKASTARSLMMHETGHVLGLYDTPKDGHVMTIHGKRAVTPSEWEINRMRQLYGAPVARDLPAVESDLPEWFECHPSVDLFRRRTIWPWGR